MNWKLWLQGLGAALISGAATGITAALVAPDQFNFSKAGLGKLATMCGVNALISGAAYIKQSPPSPEPTPEQHK